MKERPPKPPAPVSRIERAIAAVAPRYALNRMRARIAFEAASGFDAARRERPALRNMTVRSQSPDADALPGLDNQRAASRALMMNAPLAAGAIHTVVTNVVGTGLRVSARADRATLATVAGVQPDQVAAFEARAEAEWRLFCRAEHADIAGQSDFDSLQELAFRSVLLNGDCFALPVAGRGGPFDFAVQLIEADRVSNPNHRADHEGLAGGVEFDSAGAPMAYHIARIDRVTSISRDWRRYTARDAGGSPRVLHLIHRQRIGQTRGVPYLSPVVTALQAIDRYTEAEITAAVLNACIAIIGESEAGQAPMKEEAVAAGTGSTATTGLRRADIQYEPGMTLEGFMPGEAIRSFAAERPNQGFDPFVQAILRQVGVALELPFELLVKHFTASYSAARAALLQAWGFFRMRRAWLAKSFCQPVYELAITNAVVRGRIEAPGFLDDPIIRAAWLGTRWTGPSAGQIDPLKEVNAAEKRLALKLSTRTRETAELTGDDWEAVAQELASEEELLDSLGLDPALEPAARAAPSAQPMADPSKDSSPDSPDAADNTDGSDLEQPEAA